MLEGETQNSNINMLYETRARMNIFQKFCFSSQSCRGRGCLRVIIKKPYWFLKVTKIQSIFSISVFSVQWRSKKLHFKYDEDIFNWQKFHGDPSTIYSWSIGHSLEHVFFYLGHLGSSGQQGKKVDLSFSEDGFSTFCGQKKN